MSSFKKKKNLYEFQLNNTFFLLIWLSCHGTYSIIWPYFPFFLIMNFCAFNLLQIWINLRFFPLLVSAAQVLHILSSHVLMLRLVFSCQLFDGQFWPVPSLKLHRTDISAPLQIGSWFFFFCTVWGKLFLTGSSYIFISFVRLINATASSLGCLKYLEERKRFMHIFAAELDLV